MNDREVAPGQSGKASPEMGLSPNQLTHKSAGCSSLTVVVPDDVTTPTVSRSN